MKEQEISMMKFTYSWEGKDLKTNRERESQVYYQDLKMIRILLGHKKKLDL